MKLREIILTTLAVGLFSTFVLAVVNSNKRENNYHKCQNSISGTDAECDSCYQVIYCK